MAYMIGGNLIVNSCARVLVRLRLGIVYGLEIEKLALFSIYIYTHKVVVSN